MTGDPVTASQIRTVVSSDPEAIAPAIGGECEGTNSVVMAKERIRDGRTRCTAPNTNAAVFACRNDMSVVRRKGKRIHCGFMALNAQQHLSTLSDPVRIDDLPATCGALLV